MQIFLLRRGRLSERYKTNIFPFSTVKGIAKAPYDVDTVGISFSYLGEKTQQTFLSRADFLTEHFFPYCDKAKSTPLKKKNATD